MEQRAEELASRIGEQSPSEQEHLAEGEPEVHAGQEKPLEEQSARARSLKPHSRSIVDLEKLHLEPPEDYAQPRAPPKRSRKWQFGIRSRNQPYEAMLCLYKALEAQGGVWEINPAKPSMFSPRKN